MRDTVLFKDVPDCIEGLKVLVSKGEAASVPFIGVLTGAASREEIAGYPRLATLLRLTRSAVPGVLEMRR